MSAYLWTNEGLSPRNLDLLQCLAHVLSTIDGPWVVGADWNLTPADLEAAGWLALCAAPSRRPP